MNLIRRLHQFVLRHPHAGIATAGVVFVVTLLTTTAGPTGGTLDPPAVVLAAVASGVLVVRRRWPLPVLLVTTAAAEAYLVHYGGHHGEMVLAAPLIALYTVAEMSEGRRGLLFGILGVFAFAGLHLIVKPSSPLGADNIALAALGGLAVAAGEGSRIRRAYHAEVEQRALRAEAEREAEAARQVTEERLRIARDLHDAVGHQLAIIHVQAGVAAHVHDGSSVQVGEALTHIRTASKAALAELTETIGLLRQAGERTPVEPLPGMAGIDDLIASFGRSGLVISREVEGPARELSPVADATAYRVIQESLTNVCRHIGPTRVGINLTYGPAELHITVHNGPPRAADIAPTYRSTAGGGHGHVGMRERVAAAGGRFEAGRQPDGGYTVAAVLPLLPVEA